MKEFDLLVIGEINPDLILRGQDVTPAFGQAEKLIEDAALTIGSSSVIMACGAARLGLKVAFIGAVGDDEFGRFMLDQMGQRGIDTSACVVDPAVPTGMSVILSRPDDRAILTFSGTMSTLTIDQIDQGMLARARHLHLGSFFLLDALRPELPALFARAKAAGLSTSLDTNWDPQERWDSGLSQLLPHIDLFLPNEAEAKLIAGKDDLEQALSRLAEMVPTIAVKLGAEGGLVRHQGQEWRQPPLPVAVVDTTGAGDSFDAGFVYGFLNSWSQAASLKLACACGSLSTRASGGTGAQPTLIEARHALARSGF